MNLQAGNCVFVTQKCEKVGGEVIKVAGDRYSYLQIRYADIHADISADIYLHNFVHIGISADIPSICRYGSLSADIALYLQIWYVLQIS